MAMVLAVIAGFALCAAIVVLAGVRLSKYGDAIAEKTGLGGMWVGVLMLSVITSLPELVSGMSAVLVFDAPDIAVGDIAGSCLFNLAILAALDFREQQPLSARIHQGHVLVAGFGLVQLGLAALAMLAGRDAPAIGWIGLQSVAFLVIHVLAIRMMFAAERTRLGSAEPVLGDRHYEHLSMVQVGRRFAASAAVLTGAAVFLPGLAERLAEATGMSDSFVGSLFLAAATSMPEVVVSTAAARIGAIDMAVANLFGSNVFNIAVLGLDDVLYVRGPILAVVSDAHLVTLVSAMLMTAIAVIGVTYRAQRKYWRLSWDALAMLAVYAGGLGLLWWRS